jgi:hypothetical protein
MKQAVRRMVTEQKVPLTSSVHGYATGYWCAAGIFLAAAVICSTLVRPKTSMAARATVEATEEVVPAI